MSIKYHDNNVKAFFYPAAKAANSSCLSFSICSGVFIFVFLVATFFVSYSSSQLQAFNQLAGYFINLGSVLLTSMCSIYLSNHSIISFSGVSFVTFSKTFFAFVLSFFFGYFSQNLLNRTSFLLFFLFGLLVLGLLVLGLCERAFAPPANVCSHPCEFSFAPPFLFRSFHFSDIL